MFAFSGDSPHGDCKGTEDEDEDDEEEDWGSPSLRFGAAKEEDDGRRRKSGRTSWFALRGWGGECRLAVVMT